MQSTCIEMPKNKQKTKMFFFSAKILGENCQLLVLMEGEGLFHITAVFEPLPKCNTCAILVSDRALSARSPAVECEPQIGKVILFIWSLNLWTTRQTMSIIIIGDSHQQRNTWLKENNWREHIHSVWLGGWVRWGGGHLGQIYFLVASQMRYFSFNLSASLRTLELGNLFECPVFTGETQKQYRGYCSVIFRLTVY